MADKELSKRLSKFAAIGFVWDVFFAIAFPVIAFALAGRWLDTRWQTSPWMTVVGFLCAISLSSLLVYRKAKRFQSEMCQK